MKERLLIGLTGGIAGGKSTVANLLAERGFTVIDADEIVAELYRPGAAGAAVVARRFGADHLTAEGSVDRPRLAATVFADADARDTLEAAIHPLVRRRFEEIAESTPGSMVLEATLLVEAGYGPIFDQIVTIEASEEVRLGRAIARGLTPEQARARMQAQGDGSVRRAGADKILENDGILIELEMKVDDLVNDLLESTA